LPSLYSKNPFYFTVKRVFFCIKCLRALLVALGLFQAYHFGFFSYSIRHDVILYIVLTFYWALWNQLMYRKYFSLNSLPFKTTPDLAMFYKHGSRQEILEALLYTVERGDGIIKVTGEVGSGKTMLLRLLASKLPTHFEIIYVNSPNLSSKDILLYICSELDIPYHDKDQKFNLTNSIKQKLVNLHSQGKRVVMLIDEAQSMTFDALEEVRLLSNIETSNDKLLQVVLFGQPELDIALDNEKIRQLKSRISYSMFVPPLSHSEVQTYLNYRMRKAGYDDIDVFGDKVSKKIHSITSGLPRSINVVADKVLMAVFGSGDKFAKPVHLKNLPDLEGKSPSNIQSNALFIFILCLLLGIISYLLYELYLGYEQHSYETTIQNPSLQGDTKVIPSAVEEERNLVDDSTSLHQAIDISEDESLIGNTADLEPSEFIENPEVVPLNLVVTKAPDAGSSSPEAIVSTDQLKSKLASYYTVEDSRTLLNDPLELTSLLNHHYQSKQWLATVNDRYVIQLSTRHMRSLNETISFYTKYNIDVNKLHFLLDFNDKVDTFRIKVYYLHSSSFSVLNEIINNLPQKVRRSSPYIAKIEHLARNLRYTEKKLKEIGIFNE